MTTSSLYSGSLLSCFLSLPIPVCAYSLPRPVSRGCRPMLQYIQVVARSVGSRHTPPSPGGKEAVRGGGSAGGRGGEILKSRGTQMRNRLQFITLICLHLVLEADYVPPEADYVPVHEADFVPRGRLLPYSASLVLVAEYDPQR